MAKKKTNIVLKAPKQSVRNTSKHINTDISRLLIGHTDFEEAMGLVEEQAELLSVIDDNGEVERSQRKIARLNKRIAYEAKKLKRLQKEYDATDEWVETAPVIEKNGHKEKVFPLGEKIKCNSLKALGYALTVAGSMTVYANLMASGNPEFIENPVIPIVMSGLVVGSSVALKTIGTTLPLNRPQRIYRNFVNVAAGFFSASWLVLFASNFSGLTESVDWNIVTEPSGGTLYTAVHLLAEITVAASLLVNADKIAHKYNPAIKLKNLEFEGLEKALNKQTELVAKLEEEASAEETSRSIQENKRQTKVNVVRSAFLNAYRRFNQSNPDLF